MIRVPTRCLFVLLILGTFDILPLIGQESLSLFDIDVSAFPSVRGKFYALDASGDPLPGLTENDLTVTENGVARTVTRVDCSGPQSTVSLSAVLAIDISHSMTEGGPRIDIARAAARAWVQGAPLGRSECAVTSFNQKSYLNQDFTTDRTKLLQAIDGLTPEGNTDYDAALLGEPTGAIPVARHGQYRRVVVFLTDGESGTLADPVVAAALANNVTIYCVGLGIVTPQVLRDISTRTGGRWFDTITTREDAEALYRFILQDVLGRTPCTVEWQSIPGCDLERNVVLSLPSRSLDATASYDAPAGSLPFLELLPSNLAFGFVNPPGFADLNVTLTARRGAIRVSGVAIDDPSFTIVDAVPPFPVTLQSNQSQVLTVRYQAADSGYAFSRILLQSDACSDAIIYASAGFPGRTPSKPTLRVDAPNGGERVPVGGDTAITWSGVLPAETVRLEYSTDDGITWSTITDTARGLRYPWRAPNTPSNQCLMRVTQLSNRNLNDVLTLRGHTSTVRSAAFAPDGKRVVTAGDDRLGTIWNVATGTPLTSLPAHTDWVVSADFSHDGNRIVTGSFDHTAIVWDAADPNNNQSLVGHTGNVTGAHFSPDDKYIVTSSFDGTAIIWDADTRKAILTLKGHRGRVLSARFSPDGKYVVTGGADSTARIWEVAFGTMMRTLTHGDQVNDARFSVDGKRVVTGGDDGRVRIWSDAGVPIRTINAHNNRVYGVSFSPDGRLVVSGSDDGTAVLWDAVTGARLRTLVGHTGGILSVDFSGDGTTLVTASRDRTARVWTIDLTTVQQDVSDSLWAIVTPRGHGPEIDFGQVVVGVPKDTTVTAFLVNDGTVPLTISALTIGGTVPSDFSVVAGGPPFTLAVGEARGVELRFRPSATGTRTAQISSTTSTGEIILQDLRGEGIIPAALPADPIDFGQVGVGGVRDTVVELMVRNTGNSTLSFAGPTMLCPDDVHFSILAGGGAFTLTPGEGHSVTLRFMPTEIGRVQGRIAFDYGGIGGPAVVDLFGEGIMPIISTIDAIEFPPMRCESEHDTTLILRNAGASALTISDAAISGTNRDEFELLDTDGNPLSFPLDIYPGNADTLVVRAKPVDVGVRFALLTVYSNAINSGGGMVEIPLSVRKDSVGFELTPASLLFTDLSANTAATGTVTLRNTGNLPLSWNVPVDLGEFIIERIVPSTTPPGGESDVQVRYVGGPDGAVAESTYDFVDSICGRMVTLTMRAVVETVGTATLEIPGGISGAPGEAVTLPIRLRDVRNMNTVSGFETTLRFDASLLYPIDDTPRGSIVAGERTIPLSLTIPPDIGPDSVIALLRFRAMLGDALSTPLTLDDVAPVGGKAVVARIPGSFTLTDLCAEGGTRLLSTGSFSLKPARPNPAVSLAEIEYEIVEDGRVRLVVTDALGRRVTVLVDADMKAGRYVVPFDVSLLASGLYYYELRTPTQRLQRALRIAR